MLRWWSALAVISYQLTCNYFQYLSWRLPSPILATVVLCMSSGTHFFAAFGRGREEDCVGETDSGFSLDFRRHEVDGRNGGSEGEHHGGGGGWRINSEHLDHDTVVVYEEGGGAYNGIGGGGPFVTLSHDSFTENSRSVIGMSGHDVSSFYSAGLESGAAARSSVRERVRAWERRTATAPAQAAPRGDARPPAQVGQRAGQPGSSFQHLVDLAEEVATEAERCAVTIQRIWRALRTTSRAAGTPLSAAASEPESEPEADHAEPRRQYVGERFTFLEVFESTEVSPRPASAPPSCGDVVACVTSGELPAPLDDLGGDAATGFEGLDEVRSEDEGCVTVAGQCGLGHLISFGEELLGAAVGATLPVTGHAADIAEHAVFALDVVKAGQRVGAAEAQGGPGTPSTDACAGCCEAVREGATSGVIGGPRTGSPPQGDCSRTGVAPAADDRPVAEGVAIFVSGDEVESRPARAVTAVGDGASASTPPTRSTAPADAQRAAWLAQLIDAHMGCPGVSWGAAGGDAACAPTGCADRAVANSGNAVVVPLTFPAPGEGLGDAICVDATSEILGGPRSGSPPREKLAADGLPAGEGTALARSPACRVDRGLGNHCELRGAQATVAKAEDLAKQAAAADSIFADDSSLFSLSAKEIQEKEMLAFQAIVPEAVNKLDTAEDMVEKAVIISEMIAAAGDDMVEVELAVSQTEQAVSEAQKTIGEARVFLNAKQAATRRYTSDGAKKQAGEELAKLQNSLLEFQNKLNPLQTVRQEYQQRLAAQSLVAEILVKLRPAEAEVDRAEEASNLLFTEAPSKDLFNTAEQALATAQGKLTSVMSFIDSKKKAAVGVARDEIVKMEERANGPQARLLQLKGTLTEANERLTGETVIQEAAEKLQAVAESVVRAIVAGDPFLMGVEELPLEETAEAVQACEAATTAANTAVSIARMFLATKQVEAKRFAKGPAAEVTAKLKEFTEQLEAHARKIRELEASTMARKRMTTEVVLLPENVASSPARAVPAVGVEAIAFAPCVASTAQADAQRAASLAQPIHAHAGRPGVTWGAVGEDAGDSQGEAIFADAVSKILGRPRSESPPRAKLVADDLPAGDGTALAATCSGATGVVPLPAHAALGVTKGVTAVVARTSSTELADDIAPADAKLVTAVVRDVERHVGYAAQDETDTEGTEGTLGDGTSRRRRKPNRAMRIARRAAREQAERQIKLAEAMLWREWKKARRTADRLGSGCQEQGRHGMLSARCGNCKAIEPLAEKWHALLPADAQEMLAERHEGLDALVARLLAAREVAHMRNKPFEEVASCVLVDWTSRRPAAECIGASISATLRMLKFFLDAEEIFEKFLTSGSSADEQAAVLDAGAANAACRLLARDDDDDDDDDVGEGAFFVLTQPSSGLRGGGGGGEHGDDDRVVAVDGGDCDDDDRCGGWSRVGPTHHHQHRRSPSGSWVLHGPVDGVAPSVGVGPNGGQSMSGSGLASGSGVLHGSSGVLSSKHSDGVGPEGSRLQAGRAFDRHVSDTRSPSGSRVLHGPVGCVAPAVGAGPLGGQSTSGSGLASGSGALHGSSGVSFFEQSEGVGLGGSRPQAGHVCGPPEADNWSPSGSGALHGPEGGVAPAVGAGSTGGQSMSGSGLASGSGVLQGSSRGLFFQQSQVVAGRRGPSGSLFGDVVQGDALRGEPKHRKTRKPR